MLFKILIIFLFLTVLYNLGIGLFYMMKDKGRSDKTVKALTWRIGLSVLAFLLLFLGYAAGLIQPHGITPG